MTLSSKTFTTILFVFLVPLITLAERQDYLSVTGIFSNNQFVVESVEQRVFEQKNVNLYQSGTYEVRILKGKNVVGNNFFEMIENPEISRDVESKAHEISKANEATFNVKLPLNGDLDATNSVIEIWKGSNLWYSKKLIELPVEVLAVNSYAVTNPKNYPDSSYLFHLYYDNGQLVADRDVEFKYDVVPELFVPETVNTQFPYKGEIITLNGRVAGTFVFDPRRGDPSFLKGKISVKAPYAPDGEKAVFYNNQGDALLTIFVSESSFCNDDGVCNTDNGENKNTCPADCKGVTPLPPISEEPGGGQSGMLMNLVYVLIILGAGLGGWYGWRWWQKSKQSPSIEMPTDLPTAPPTSNNPI